MLIYAILLSAIGMKSMYVLFGVYLGIFLLYLLISKGLPFIKKYFEEKKYKKKVNQDAQNFEYKRSVFLEKRKKSTIGK